MNEPAQTALLKNFGAVINKPLRLINGISVYLPVQAEKALAKSSEILRIDEDLVITTLEKPAGVLGKVIIAAVNNSIGVGGHWV